MTEVDVLKLITILEGAYGKAMGEKTLDVYSVMLADLPYDAAQMAVVRLIATSKFLPTIAEIRRAAAETQCNIPSAEVAWIEVRQAARDYSPYTKNQHEWSHPLVRKAAEVLGGVGEIGYSDNIQYLGHQFRQVYERLRESEMVRLQTDGVRLLGHQPQALPGQGVA